MKGTLSHELEISLPADEIWSVYRGLELAELVVKLLPTVIYKMDLVEGDGGVGTILHLYFPPGTPLVQSYKEKFTKIDDEKRIKEAYVVEGGYLELGFISYMVRFEVIEKSEADSIIMSTIEYEVDEDFASKASLISTAPLAIIHETVGKYLIEKKSNA
ncbi:norbelladine synthase-like [Dioscorea cayenensis subsp. rotundata]|uniref:Norbelladine synthase-like n=1 Tax=Dioscorea cayennensis subsp. rotundata TaxID=55577 RepID=A0AB40B6J4_DIOCR|nr:norbelladine synthase-like [Dioscorea cayenensis subsp. rotundata]